jgi:threonine dehydrogenase-like Zn-dependent dehydrogenase
MKALVRVSPEVGDMEIRDVPKPSVEPGKVLLKVSACGICGSDVGDWQKRTPEGKPYPYVIGHEFAGLVAELGEGVEDFAPGDAVATEPFYVWCGKCAMCRIGRVNNCRAHSDMGFGVDGGMAEYALVPVRGLHRLPAHVDPVDAAILEPVAVSYNCLFAEANVNPGDFVVVLGCGPIGLLCASLALAAGAEVLLTGRDGNEFRMDEARLLGVQHIVNVSHGSAAEEVSRLAGTDGPDLIVDATGSTDAFGEALAMAGMCGTVVKVGWFHAPGNVPLNAMVAKNLQVRGVYGHTWPVWEKSVRCLAAGKIPLAQIVSARLPLEQWEEGFGKMRDREAVKVLLVP